VVNVTDDDNSARPGAPLHRRAELERARRGWSKPELARRAGIGRVTYDRLATQSEPPIARTVHKLCAALDIDVAEGLRLAGLDTAAAPADPEQPEWARNLQQAAADLQKGLAQTSNVLAAQAAMGWAYRGDLTGTRTALSGMSPEQLRELSAAASMLAALADEELSTR